MRQKERMMVISLLVCVSLFFSLSAISLAKTTVVMWGTWDPSITDDPGAKYVRQMLANFESTRPDIKIEYVALSHEVIERNFAIASQAENPPDVVHLRRHLLATHVNLGSLAALNDYYEQKWDNRPQIFPNFMADVTFGNQIMGIPYFTDTVLFYYRKDWHDELGLEVARTWGELTANAIPLTREVDGKKVWGFGTITSKTLVTPERWFYFLLPAGGEPITPPVNGKATYHLDAGVKALQFHVDLANKYKVMPPGVETSMDDLFLGFSGGVYAQAPMGTWQMPKLMMSPEWSRVGITRIPIPQDGKDRIYAGGWVWAMSKQSTLKDAAWEVIESFAGTKGQVALGKATQGGNYPISYPALDDAFFKKGYMPLISDYIKEAGASFPQHAHYKELLDGLNNAIQMAIMGVKTAEEALIEAAEAFNSTY